MQKIKNAVETVKEKVTGHSHDDVGTGGQTAAETTGTGYSATPSSATTGTTGTGTGYGTGTGHYGSQGATGVDEYGRETTGQKIKDTVGDVKDRMTGQHGRTGTYGTGAGTGTGTGTGTGGFFSENKYDSGTGTGYGATGTHGTSGTGGYSSSASAGQQVKDGMEYVKDSVTGQHRGTGTTGTGAYDSSGVTGGSHYGSGTGTGGYGTSGTTGTGGYGRETPMQQMKEGAEYVKDSVTGQHRTGAAGNYGETGAYGAGTGTGLGTGTGTGTGTGILSSGDNKYGSSTGTTGSSYGSSATGTGIGSGTGTGTGYGATGTDTHATGATGTGKETMGQKIKDAMEMVKEKVTGKHGTSTHSEQGSDAYNRGSTVGNAGTTSTTKTGDKDSFFQ